MQPTTLMFQVDQASQDRLVNCTRFKDRLDLPAHQAHLASLAPTDNLAIRAIRAAPARPACPATPVHPVDRA